MPGNEGIREPGYEGGTRVLEPGNLISFSSSKVSDSALLSYTSQSRKRVLLMPYSSRAAEVFSGSYYEKYIWEY